MLIKTCTIKELKQTGQLAWARVKELEATGKYLKVMMRRNSMYSFAHTVYAYEMAEEPENRMRRAECQICARQQAVREDDRLVDHGYTRPGWGFIVGNCYGARHLEYTKGKDALEAMVRDLTVQLKSQDKVIAATKKATTFGLPYQVDKIVDGKPVYDEKRRRVRETRTWTVNKKGFDPKSPKEFSVYLHTFEDARAYVLRPQWEYQGRIKEALFHFTTRLKESPVK